MVKDEMQVKRKDAAVRRMDLDLGVIVIGLEACEETYLPSRERRFKSFRRLRKIYRKLNTSSATSLRMSLEVLWKLRLYPGEERESGCSCLAGCQNYFCSNKGRRQISHACSGL